MTRASVYTLLSLDRYSQILGINPLHFAGATAGDYFPLRTRCSDLWKQFSWQASDSVSREDLALAFLEAEKEITCELGYYPGSRWTSQEMHKFPRFHRREYYQRYGYNVRGERKSVTTRHAKVIQLGRRATILIDTASVAAGTLTYTDADGDGFTELATITLPTTLLDPSEIKVYHPGHSAAQIWEIRDPLYREIGAGSVEIRFYVWQMILPALWETFPLGFPEEQPDAIDLSGLIAVPPALPDTSKLVQSVEVYREYTKADSTDDYSAVTFYWEPLPNCDVCALATQNGCLHVRDPELGVVVPEPATYSDTDGIWLSASYSESREPDFLKIWYKSGFLDDRFLSGSLDETLTNRWHQPIAWLATARLERPFCSCGNVTALAKHWREDLALVGDSSHQVDMRDLSNPFGTRRGEIMAWRQVSRTRDRSLGGGVA